MKKDPPVPDRIAVMREKVKKALIEFEDAHRIYMDTPVHLNSGIEAKKIMQEKSNELSRVYTDYLNSRTL